LADADNERQMRRVALLRIIRSDDLGAILTDHKSDIKSRNRLDELIF